jgi:type I restriction enzyme S subunit
MELSTSRKQTEVGVIPKDWDIVTIGEMFTFKNGLNKAKRFFGYGTPIVNYMDVFRFRGLAKQLT